MYFFLKKPHLLKLQRILSMKRNSIKPLLAVSLIFSGCSNISNSEIAEGLAVLAVGGAVYKHGGKEEFASFTESISGIKKSEGVTKKKIKAPLNSKKISKKDPIKKRISEPLPTVIVPTKKAVRTQTRGTNTIKRSDKKGGFSCYEQVRYNGFLWKAITDRKKFRTVSMHTLFSLPKNFMPIPEERVDVRLSTSSRDLTYDFRSIENQCTTIFNKRISSKWWKNKDIAYQSSEGSLEQCKKNANAYYAKYRGLMCD